MKGFQVTFNVYANSKEEAEAASNALRTFVDDQAKQGRAVTAQKITDAINKYKNNYFVTSYFN